MRGNRTYDVYLTYNGSPASRANVRDYDLYGYVGGVPVGQRYLITEDIGNCGLGWNITPGEFSKRNDKSFVRLNGGFPHNITDLYGKWQVVDKPDWFVEDLQPEFNIVTPEYKYHFGRWKGYAYPNSARMLFTITKIIDNNGNFVQVDWWGGGSGELSPYAVPAEIRIPQKIVTPTDTCWIERKIIMPDSFPNCPMKFYVIDEVKDSVNGELFKVEFYYSHVHLDSAMEYWYTDETVLLDSIAFFKNDIRIKPSYKFFYNLSTGELIKFITPEGGIFEYFYQRIKGAQPAGDRLKWHDYRRIYQKKVYEHPDSTPKVYLYDYKDNCNIANGSVACNSSIPFFYPIYKKCNVVLPEGDSILYVNIDQNYVDGHYIARYLTSSGSWQSYSLNPERKNMELFLGKPYKIIKYYNRTGAKEMERLYWRLGKARCRLSEGIQLFPVLKYRAIQKDPDDEEMQNSDKNWRLYEYLEYDKYVNPLDYKFIGTIEYLGSGNDTVTFYRHYVDIDSVRWITLDGKLLYNDTEINDGWRIKQEYLHETNPQYDTLCHLVTSKKKYDLSGNLIEKSGFCYDDRSLFDVSYPVMHLESYGQDYTKRGNLTAVSEWKSQGKIRSTRLYYDILGNMVGQVDFNGNAYQYEYLNPWGERTYVFPEKKFYPDGSIEKFYFYKDGNLKKFIDKNCVTKEFSYDCFGRLTREAVLGGYYKGEPSKPLNIYQYDDFNNIAKEISISSPEVSDTTVYYYDGLGRLKKTERLNSLSMNGGITKTYHYNKNGFLYKESPPRFINGGFHHYVVKEFDVLGRITKIYEPHKNSDWFFVIIYEYQGDTIKFKDEHRIPTTFIYDAAGNLKKHIDPHNESTEYSYNPRRELTQIKDALNRSTTFSYNWLSQVIQRNNVDRGIDKFYYDNNGNLTFHTLNPEGDLFENSISYGYDNLDRVTEKKLCAIDDSGYIHYITDTLEKYYYDNYNIDDTSYSVPESLNFPAGRLTGFDNSYLREIYLYDKLGRLSGKWTIPVESADTGIVEIDTVWHDTLFSNTESNPLEVGGDSVIVNSAPILLNGNDYIILHLSSTVKDPKAIFRLQLKIEGWEKDDSVPFTRVQVREKYPPDVPDTLLFDIISDLEKGDIVESIIVKNTGSCGFYLDSLFLYSPLDDTLYDTTFSITRNYAKGQKLRFFYDLQSRLTGLRYPDYYQVDYLYDRLGSISSVIIGGRDTVAISSTASGLVSEICLPGGVTDNFEYDEHDWMENMSITGNNISYEREFEYNFRGELLREYDGTQYTAIYEYDSIGRLLSEEREDPAITHTFGYDAVGNRTNIDGVNYQYYNGTNRLMDDGTYTYEYNPIGCPISRNDNVDFSYDTEGRLTGVDFPGMEGKHYRFYYSGGKRVKQKVWWKEREFSPIMGQQGGNKSLPKAPPSKWVTKRKEYNYLYDNAGNRVIVDNGSPNLIENKGFEKGNLDHWLQWSSDGILDWEITSDYSQEGMYCLYSPYFSSSGTSECAMQYFSLSDFDKPFNASCWVKTENLTGGVRIDVTFWNSDWSEGYGQKSSSTTTGTNDWRNIGLVVNESDIPEQAVNCKVIVRRIQGSGELWVDNVRCEEGESRTPEKRYIYAGRRLIGMEKDGSVYFHHLDRVGSPVIVTDRNGNMKRTNTYEAFGNINAHSGGLGDDVRFTSKEQDGTGLHYFGARYYNSDWGRFLTPDPHSLNPGNLNLSDPQTFNPYAYCSNDPLRYIDPNGKFMIIVEYNQSAQYGSKALVWNGWLPDGIYDMKTRADIRGTNAAVKGGIYDYELGTHKGRYFAKHKALIINKGKAVPTEKPNPVQGGKKEATGIRVHAGNRKANEGRSGSAGCWTVPTVEEPAPREYKIDRPETWDYYKEYIENFEEYPEGKVWLIRLDKLFDFFREDKE